MAVNVNAIVARLVAVVMEASTHPLKHASQHPHAGVEQPRNIHPVLHRRGMHSPPALQHLGAAPAPPLPLQHHLRASPAVIAAATPSLHHSITGGHRGVAWQISPRSILRAAASAAAPTPSPGTVATPAAATLIAQWHCSIVIVNVAWHPAVRGRHPCHPTAWRRNTTPPPIAH